MMPTMPRSTVSKDVVIDWLNEVPEEAQIGIDVGEFGQRDLVAFLEAGETDMWILALDSIPCSAEKPMLDESRERMMDRLRQTDQPEKGVIIVTIEGVVSGVPDLFSMSVHEAFYGQRQDRQKSSSTSFSMC
jgi:hypothetical protein